MKRFAGQKGRRASLASLMPIAGPMRALINGMVGDNRPIEPQRPIKERAADEVVELKKKIEIQKAIIEKQKDKQARKAAQRLLHRLERQSANMSESND